MNTHQPLNLKDIIAVDDSQFTNLFIKEWNGTVRVYVMSLGERLDFESTHSNDKGIMNFNDKTLIEDLVAICVRDEQGNRLFNNQESLKIVREKNNLVIQKIFKECSKLNFMTNESAEDLEKNL